MTLLAVLPAHPGFLTALEFILTGFFLVLAALFALSGFISLLGLLFKARKVQGAAAGASRSPSPADTGTAAEPAAHRAVIVAAVHVALKGQPHRIVRVSPAGIGWAQEGRREIFSSHRIR